MSKYQARFLPNAEGEPEWAILPYEAYQELLAAAQGELPPQKAEDSIDNTVAQALANNEPLSLAQICAQRLEKGLSEQDMAREVGISPLYYQQIEAGEREASPAIHSAIARAFSRL